MQGISSGLRELQLKEDEEIVSKLRVYTDVVVTCVLHLVLEPDEAMTWYCHVPFIQGVVGGQCYVLVQDDLSRLQEICENQRRKINEVNNQLKAEQAELRKAHLDLQKACSGLGFRTAQAEADAEAMQNAADWALRGQRAAEEAEKEAVRAKEKAQAQMQQQQHQAANPDLLQIAKLASDHCARGTRFNISSSLGEQFTQSMFQTAALSALHLA